MEDYDSLLERAQAKIPQSSLKTERFEIPKVRGHLQGNKTVITNFKEICDTIRRDQAHFLKYLLRELATPGNVDGPRLVLGRKISSSIINGKIERYVNDFVLCPVCKKPDTTLTKEDRITMIKCSACGSKNPVHAKI
ncbi:MAG TPA: translation initiation factor IF-2 subunit beta [Candidatus Nanoarchaeia archaeon]|nr:translation initiation factor IF-2 subunit beta [Candidatus Nanoarchaeia archaeon]